MSAAVSRSESSYIASGIFASSRADGRSLTDYRLISLTTGVAPQANGSARVRIAETDVVVGVKAEVEDVEGEGTGEGRSYVECSVECSPSAHHHLDSRTLEDYTTSLTTILVDTISHNSPFPHSQFVVVPGRRSWKLYVDAIILEIGGGNVYDALFIAVRSALWDTRLPVTRGIAYEAPGGGSADGITATPGLLGKDGDLDRVGIKGSIRSKEIDFELEDTGDDGRPLIGRERLPVCITLNLLGGRTFLDATLAEELCTSTRILVVVEPSGRLCTMRQLGSGEVDAAVVKETMKTGIKYAVSLCDMLDKKLRDPATARAGGVGFLT